MVGDSSTSIFCDEEWIWFKSVPLVEALPGGLPPNHLVCQFLYLGPVLVLPSAESTLWTANPCCETNAEKMLSAVMLGTQQAFRDCSLNKKSSTWKKQRPTDKQHTHCSPCPCFGYPSLPARKYSLCLRRAPCDCLTFTLGRKHLVTVFLPSMGGADKERGPWQQGFSHKWKLK